MLSTMEKKSILIKLHDILADIIDNEELVINENSEWDSLVHFQLVMELQNEFSIKLKSSEILSWKNVGDIISCIQEKQQ